MPTYSYICDACGHQFDQFQAISEEPIRACPVCEQERVRRLIGAGAGLIFKGSGFYITDYARKSSQGKPTPSSNGQDKKAEPKAEAPSVSKQTEE
ncbi:MAG: zinc ribbon domain-containing protein [Fidelibacterota bacterium]|nr:MAG: zinc ribbon domain-containing protein [Candidatus Neomarinimicrobiota bacterium]